MCIEGMVSQIMFIGTRFCFIKSGKKTFEKYPKKSRFFSNKIKNRASIKNLRQFSSGRMFLTPLKKFNIQYTILRERSSA